MSDPQEQMCRRIWLVIALVCLVAIPLATGTTIIEGGQALLVVIAVCGVGAVAWVVVAWFLKPFPFPKWEWPWEKEHEEPTAPTEPTAAQLTAAARARYEATLRMLESAGLDENELHAARERAKQKYLRDIDGVLQ